MPLIYFLWSDKSIEETLDSVDYWNFRSQYENELIGRDYERCFVLNFIGTEENNTRCLFMTDLIIGKDEIRCSFFQTSQIIKLTQDVQLVLREISKSLLDHNCFLNIHL